jgi:hypothetical protein
MDKPPKELKKIFTARRNIQYPYPGSGCIGGLKDGPEKNVIRAKSVQNRTNHIELSLLTGFCCSCVVALHFCTILYGFSPHSRVRVNENAYPSPPLANHRVKHSEIIAVAPHLISYAPLCTSSFYMALPKTEAAFPLLHALTCELYSPLAALHRCRAGPSCAAFKCSRRVASLILDEEDINITTVPRVFTQELGVSERRKGRGLYRQGTGERNADPEQMCAATPSTSQAQRLFFFLSSCLNFSRSPRPSIISSRVFRERENVAEERVDLRNGALVKRNVLVVCVRLAGSFAPLQRRCSNSSSAASGITSGICTGSCLFPYGGCWPIKDEVVQQAQTSKPWLSPTSES